MEEKNKSIGQADIMQLAETIETDEIKETPDGRRVGFKNGKIVYTLYDNNKDGKFDAIDINHLNGIKTYSDTDGNGIVDKLEEYDYKKGRITKTKIDSDENGIYETVYNHEINSDFQHYIDNVEYHDNETNILYAKDNLIKETNCADSREEDTNGDGKLDKKTNYAYISAEAIEKSKNKISTKIPPEEIIRSNTGISYIDKDGDGHYETMSFE